MNNALGLKSPIIIPIDTRDLAEAAKLVETFGGVANLKFGSTMIKAMESSDLRWMANAASGLMWDEKFNDIPTQVAGAVAEVVEKYAPRILTVHANSGPDTLEAALKAAAGSNTLITAITVLTSMSDNAAQRVYGKNAAQASLDLAILACECGVPALVCSPLELQILRAKFPDVILITPGIREAGSPDDDQARKATPAEAAAWGANGIVVGRLITKADKPVQKLQQVHVQFNSAIA